MESIEPIDVHQGRNPEKVARDHAVIAMIARRAIPLALFALALSQVFG